MCDTFVLNLIDEVIQDNVKNLKTFSAFDVTLVVQKKLRADNVFDSNSHRHRHLRNDIHKNLSNYVRNGLYKKELIDYAGNSVFEYSPVNSSNVATTVAPQSANTSNVTNSNIQQVNQLNKEVGKPDSRGTLCVPNSYVKLAFKDRSLRVKIYKKNKSLVVSQIDNLNSENPITEYTIDSSNNIRITHSVLVTGFGTVDANSRYDFSIETDGIVLTLK